jgi:CRP/FNR family transcriptional regulator
LKPTLTTIEKALFIKELEYFEHVSIEQAADVAAFATEVEYEPGATVVVQGEPSEHIFLVIEGRATAERDGVIYTVFEPGRGFGDLTLGQDPRYAFTTRAATHLHVLRFSTASLVESMLEHPEIAVGIVRALASRLREVSEQLAQLSKHVQDSSGTFRMPEIRP